MTIANRTIKRIAEVLDIPVDKISPTSTVAANLGCDSLEVLEVIMALEEEFGCSIADDTAQTFKSVQDIIDHVHGIVHVDDQDESRPHERHYPSRQELIVAVASYMNVSSEKATKWLESEFAAGAA